MRFQPELSTYPHGPQRKKKNQKERNDYDYAFNLLNPEGTIHVLLKGDILTSYEQIATIMKEGPHPPINKVLKIKLINLSSANFIRCYRTPSAG